jgi:hypothetical protein
MNNKLIPPDAAADQAENAEPEIETYRPDYCSGNDPYVVILDPPPPRRSSSTCAATS